MFVELINLSAYDSRDRLSKPLLFLIIGYDMAQQFLSEQIMKFIATQSQFCFCNYRDLQSLTYSDWLKSRIESQASGPRPTAQVLFLVPRSHLSSLCRRSTSKTRCLQLDRQGALSESTDFLNFPFFIYTYLLEED